MQTLEAELHTSALDDKIEKICRDLSKLDPGPLAELRRMDATSNEYGAPFFWRLCARYNLPFGETTEQTWAQVIQTLATLTPKGRDENKRSRHTKQPGLGRMLCDGGDRGWRPEDPANPKPMYSEARLAQLLGSSGETRVELVLRLARMLAARLPPEAAFDCTDIARLLLYADDPGVGRRIARDYYARFDGARRTADLNDDDTNSTGDES